MPLKKIAATKCFDSVMRIIIIVTSLTSPTYTVTYEKNSCFWFIGFLFLRQNEMNNKI